MKILFYSAKKFEIDCFLKENFEEHQIDFIFEPLNLDSAAKALGYEGICAFVTDDLSEPVISKLAVIGIKLIALRSAGYDHVDISSARRHKVTVVRVPDYSPESVAEFAVALLLSLSRNIIKGYKNSLEHNFLLDDLIGFNLHQKNIGIIGTGRIGTAFARIIKGFGCNIEAFDPKPNKECKDLGVKYVDFFDLIKNSDVVSLHCLLDSTTYHLLGEKELRIMKKGAILINTSRGAILDTKALIDALEKNHLKSAALDVYEMEKNLYFRDLRKQHIIDKQFLKLISLPNVIITPHQAFLTSEAIKNIAKITIKNINAFLDQKPINLVT
jgi:D-lactate dehydrogenase